MSQSTSLMDFTQESGYWLNKRTQRLGVVPFIRKDVMQGDFMFCVVFIWYKHALYSIHPGAMSPVSL